MHGVGGASLLVGGAGTAKTATVAQFLASFSAEGPAATLSKVVTFSSLTTPHIFQLTIEGAVEKRQGRTCVLRCVCVCACAGVCVCVFLLASTRTIVLLCAPCSPLIYAHTHNTLTRCPHSLTPPKQHPNPNQKHTTTKTTKKRYGPPGGKRMVVFIDDLGMPAVNEWGDQVLCCVCCVCCAALCAVCAVRCVRCTLCAVCRALRRSCIMECGG